MKTPNFKNCFLSFIPFSFLVMTLVMSLNCLAEIKEFILWRPEKNGPHILFPLRSEDLVDADGKETAIRQYLQKIQQVAKSGDLAGYRNILPWVEETLHSLETHQHQFTTFNPQGPQSEKPLMIILTNQVKSMMSDDRTYSQKLDSHFNRLGAEAHVLPMGLNKILSEEELGQVRNFLIENYNGMVAPGGDDIHPDLYHRPIAGAHLLDLNKDRDILESSFIRSWLNYGDGKFFGICRGHQLRAVTDSAKMIQDIAEPRKREVISVTLTGDLKKNLLCRILGKNQNDELAARQVKFYAFHHQAVEEDADLCSMGKIIARDSVHPDIIQAIELSNGRGLTTQFHPEKDLNDTVPGYLQINEDGRKVLHYMVSQANFHRKKRLLEKLLAPIFEKRFPTVLKVF